MLDIWRADYNGVHPHSALANKTPAEFRTQHIAVAASPGNGQDLTQDSPHDWREDGAQVKSDGRRDDSMHFIFAKGRPSRVTSAHWVREKNVSCGN